MARALLEFIVLLAFIAVMLKMVDLTIRLMHM